MVRVYLFSIILMVLLQYQSVNSEPLQDCGQGDQCPEGSVCLGPGFGKASGKANGKAKRKCYPCCCQERGQCSIKNRRHVSCECGDSGFTGRCCNINIDDCDPNPCQNNGTCIDGINNYTCSCPSSFMGRNCEEPVSTCDPTLCKPSEDDCNGSDDCFLSYVHYRGTWPTNDNTPLATVIIIQPDPPVEFCAAQCTFYHCFAFGIDGDVCYVYGLHVNNGLQVIEDFNDDRTFYSRDCFPCM